ncbi:MerR family transcriptional regulator [Streptomyces sp. CB03238]|uniref:MerR family transcriptional regulator n=1 Tax=Streptomyces sp. CB03238 TaxID=1907777 RepID=UPI000A116399|nr:MerR family transcriptional regulator [Streptomyces sp. CB03238]ORT58194.1 hypothetical protein BKD26_20030 [Streptomyces sp. CB03238]
MRDWDSEFATIAGPPPTQFYPGSTRRISRRPVRTQNDVQAAHQDTYVDHDRWDAKPQVKPFGGGYREFFGIGDLAKALHRDAVTMRKWEANGVIPKATYVISGKTANGNRRLYTREQIEVIVRIAHEEGLFDGDPRGIRITDTNFTQRVKDAFEQLRQKETAA